MELVWEMAKIIRESNPLIIDPWAPRGEFREERVGFNISYDWEGIAQALIDAGYRKRK
jgi:hypothetical protein